MLMTVVVTGMLLSGWRDAAAQDIPSGPDLKLVPARATGVKNYTPETWGLMTLDLTNAGEEPVEVTASRWGPNSARIVPTRSTAWMSTRRPYRSRAPDAPPSRVRIPMAVFVSESRCGGRGVVVRSWSSVDSRIVNMNDAM